MDKATTSSIDTISRTCIVVRLLLLNRVVTNFYDDAFRALGLKVSQLNIPIVTARLGLARPAQVCEILQLDASTLSRNVKPLQAHGWLEVVPDEDARAQPFRLTPQGRRLIEKAVPAWEEAQRQDSSQLRLPHEPGADPQHRSVGRQPRIPPHRRSGQRGRPQDRGDPGA